ncbi:hypothetical protein Blastoid_43 [Bacillus phage Blastoid]|uniref:Uncharacterized protein n=1 Tax=Bacillus phage Blastoid TaxID=2880540 RepID=U5PW64_9CAUD|nr:hypothetical protein V456_gp43 [Bacillus phage Blastoid]AGY46842.1 hypothetical protein Blastoid_43 [Bacillus phage Blastoid]
MASIKRKIIWIDNQIELWSTIGETEELAMLQDIRKDLQNYEKLKQEKPKVIVREVEVDNTPYGVDWDF